MARKPQKPQLGQPAIKALYNSVCDVIDYLPSLEVVGDQKSTYVTKSSAGTVIHATQQSNIAKTNQYAAGSGLFLSGNVFNVGVDGITVKIVNNKLSCTVEGGGGGGPDHNTLYTGDANYYSLFSGNHIYVDPSPLPNTDTHLISSTLYWIKDLANDKIISDGTTSIREDRLSDVTIPGQHFIQTQDLIYQKGINAQITSGTWLQNVSPDAIIDPDTGQTVKLKHWSGLQVDCVLTGGRFIEVNDHWGNGTEYDPDDHTINSLLSGDNQHIFISQQTPNENGSWGGIISTNIHGDETTIHMAADGTLSAIGGGGGGGGTGDQNIVYVTQQGIITVQPHTKYIVLLDPVLSTNLNDDTESESWHWYERNYVYKYFYFDDNPESYPANKIIMETTVRYDSQSQQYLYGAYYNNEWRDYDEGGKFGVQFIFPNETATTHVQIITFRNSNVALTAPNSILYDLGHPSKPTSGTTGQDWIYDMVEHSNRYFMWSPEKNWWYSINA